MSPARSSARPVRRATAGAARRLILRGLPVALVGALGAALIGAGGSAWATDGPDAPPLRVGEMGDVLTIVARDASGAPRLIRSFDLAALAALPQHTLVATVPWYGQTHRFAGPLLRDVLAGAGTTSRRTTAVALNGYQVEIPLDDAARWPVIVALRVDDRPVAVRDKGPLMIMYPFDDDRSLRQARFYGRAVWQLRTIELR